MTYNALIREYSARSLEILQRVLIADFKDIPADWKIRYNCKEVNRNTTNISDLCCSFKNPLQIYKPFQNCFPVQIRTTDGKSIEILVSPTDTIKVLKLKIFQLDQDYIPIYQKLTLERGGQQISLKKWQTMDFLGINSGSKFILENDAPKLHNHAVANPRQPKPDMESTHTPQSFNNNSTPEWAKYAAGLNITGRCSNQFCDTNDVKLALDVVARPVRYGDVVINFASSQNPLNCSTCCINPSLISVSNGDGQFKIVPKRVVLKEARATISYRKSGENVAHQEFFKHKVEKGKFSTVFSTVFETSGGQLDVLEIKAVEPWNSPFSCVKCDTMIGRKFYENQLECGHVYHSWCHKAAALCAACNPNLPNY